jgi:hypothetical protein
VVGEVVVGITSDSPGKYHVLFHYRGSVCMNGTQVGVLEDADEVGFRRLLESDESVGLETEVVVNG